MNTAAVGIGIVIVIVVVVILARVAVAMAAHVLRQYRRGVVFRLGKVTGERRPGLCIAGDDALRLDRSPTSASSMR